MRKGAREQAPGPAGPERQEAPSGPRDGAHLWVERVVLGRLCGQQDVSEAVLLPDDDVPVPVGAFRLPHAETQPLVEGLVSSVVDEFPLPGRHARD